MMPMYARQILAVLRLELKKTFFSRRGLWVYLVALAPALLYFAQDLEGRRFQEQLASYNRDHHVKPYVLEAITTGDSKAAITGRLGDPYRQRVFKWGRGRDDQRASEIDWYTDGVIDARMVFDTSGTLIDIRREGPPKPARQTEIFATLFQNVYLRLGVYFGCIGIFANLFRGEMLDKSLHYYLLTPMRREILVGGKFLAGLLVMCVIFGAGTVLQYAAMLGQFSHADAMAMLSDHGWAIGFEYLGVTLLACVAYGSLFLALGLLFRNPVVPAAFVLMWESIVIFMPVSLRELSIIYYLQSCCPAPAQVDPTLPQILQMLISTDNTMPSVGWAIVVLAIVAMVCVGIAAFRGRRLEINYGIE